MSGSEASLLSEADVWDRDPIRPDLDHPTPPSVVATLTRKDAERRVRWLIDQAHEIYELGLTEHLAGREVTARCVLFSGGNDSTTLAHLFRDKATHAIHANTTIGAEETRQYVRDVCTGWALNLIEVLPDDTYEDLILGRVKTKAGDIVWPGGFPGPGAHGFIYQRIKERALDKARHVLGIANSTKRAGVFIAGRRRLESDRRSDIPLHESDGSVIWVSPIANWSKLDMNTYRLLHRDSDNPVPRNWVADLMHMSMECLCGAYAHQGELAEIRQWFPHIAAEIDRLQALVMAAIDAGGLDIDPAFAVWGHRLGKPSKSGRLCSSCDARFTPAGIFAGGDAA